MAICVGNEVYSNEVQRWCPDKQFFAHSEHQLPSGQADVIEVRSVTLSCIHGHNDVSSCRNLSIFCTYMLASL